MTDHSEQRRPVLRVRRQGNRDADLRKALRDPFFLGLVLVLRPPFSPVGGKVCTFGASMIGEVGERSVPMASGAGDTRSRLYACDEWLHPGFVAEMCRDVANIVTTYVQ